MTLGARVRATREKRGLKQVDVARAIGVSPHTLWRIEAGQHENPRRRVLEGLSRELRVSVDYLLTGSSSRRRTAN